VSGLGYFLASRYARAVDSLTVTSHVISEFPSARVGTKFGTTENTDDSYGSVGAKGGTRTPTVLPARS
jgi:hypothetical protein